MRLVKAENCKAENCPVLLLYVRAEDADTLAAQLTALAQWRDTCCCRILAQGDVAALNTRFGSLLDGLQLDPIEHIEMSLTDLRETILAGALEDVDSATLISDLSYMSATLLPETQAVIAGCGDIKAPIDMQIGCTLVTSVFRSDRFIRGFLNNSAALTGYGPLIDHIFLVAKLSAVEIAHFTQFVAQHRNAILHWNRSDPGLYNCWNQGIRMARRCYVSNANVDDLRDPDHVITLLCDLEARPECVVAASALKPFHDFPEDGTLPDIQEHWYSDQAGYFDSLALGRLQRNDQTCLEPHNLPHCMPVWRRSLHDHHGWFDEGYYGTYADWAFWLKALQNGPAGWLNPAPMGYYFVNPTSHNRRGSDLQEYHARVERDFIGPFLARASGLPPHAARPIPTVQPKLQLVGKSEYFGVHRNSFNKLIGALDPLECTQGAGTLFIPFIERQFVWGSTQGEAASENPRPLTQPWIGILHVPFEAPPWFLSNVSPEQIFASDLWQRSRPYCQGVICLARSLEADLKIYDPDLPTLSVRHPTSFDAPAFNPDAYRAAQKVVQVGDWLRKLQAIHQLRAPEHARIMLLKPQTEEFLEREIAEFGDHRDPSVDMRYLVPDEEYDALLSSSVVLCLLYGTAANNVVIECLARATPILINPLPAVVEYLGQDYPFYARDPEEADALLRVEGLVEDTHAYMRARREKIDLTYGGFCRDIAASALYQALPSL